MALSTWLRYSVALLITPAHPAQNQRSQRDEAKPKREGRVGSAFAEALALALAPALAPALALAKGVLTFA
eukprot:scaffold2710_cov204-Pinguiococcus_pyrenoidosus.AAC.3